MTGIGEAQSRRSRRDEESHWWCGDEEQRRHPRFGAVEPGRNFGLRVLGQVDLGLVFGGEARRQTSWFMCARKPDIHLGMRAAAHVETITDPCILTLADGWGA